MTTWYSEAATGRKERKRERRGGENTGQAKWMNLNFSGLQLFTQPSASCQPGEEEVLQVAVI
jgi:hypothetical protein